MWVVKEIKKNVYRKYYKPDDTTAWVILTAIMAALVIMFTRLLLG